MGEEEREGMRADAGRSGFRVLPKARWDALQAEYLAYRQRLLTEIARTDAAARADTRAYADEQGDAGAESMPSVDLAAPYPPGCLVLVRNVPTATNKTALKALFAAHASPDPSSAAAANAVSYVDYTKGMTIVSVPFFSLPLLAREYGISSMVGPCGSVYGVVYMCRRLRTKIMPRLSDNPLFLKMRKKNLSANAPFWLRSVCALLRRMVLNHI